MTIDYNDLTPGDMVSDLCDYQINTCTHMELVGWAYEHLRAHFDGMSDQMIQQEWLKLVHQDEEKH